MNRWLPVVATFAATLGSAGVTRLHAQGTTTGAITGTVTDANGQPLVAAQVEVVNRATGARAGQQTRETGRYFVPNLDVGGGYTVTVRRIGYAPQTRNDVRVVLSQAARLDFRLESQATQLSTVTVTAPTTASDFTPTRQGAQTVVSDTVVRRNPTLNRDVADLTRLTPQVSVTPSGRQSAAGQSNRFSNIQVDGVSLANRFGLGDSPTLGAQVGGRALPLEAIKEFQVLLSPYDVRQGNFTGALVNAVTQSGTNEFHGSAFGYYRDQTIASNDPFVTARPFVRRQFGGSLGGPIVRDKLRFFATVETSQNRNPASGPFFDPTLSNGLNGAPTITTRITSAQIDSFTTRAQALGIPAGTATTVQNANPLLNTFGRLDWQISGGTRLVLRNIYNNQKLDNFSRTTGTFGFSNNGFRGVERSNQTVAQLFSSFGAGVSNEAILGYTQTRFKRNPYVIAPQVLVQNIGGTNSGVGFRLGTENSSQGNELKEDLFEIQDNVTVPLGAHTLTFGTRNEIYKVYNAFLQNSFGNYTFGSLADFVAGRNPTQFSGAGAVPGGENGLAARFRAGQFGGYVQDQWTVNPRLTLTLGLRADVPVLFNKPLASPTVQADFGRSTRDVPSGHVQWSPRLGFNSDLTGDQRNQLRGGVGLFQGPPAYVWISNQFTNTGAGFAQFTCGSGNTNGTAPAFDPSPVSPRGCGPLAGFTAASGLNGTPGRNLDNRTLLGTVNLADKNLKFPQLLRATLGYDRQLPGGVVATLEGLYSKNLNNFLYTNVNLTPDAQTRIDAQGRRVYNQIAGPGVVNASGQSQNGIPQIVPRFPIYGTNVINLTNQSKDYSYSATAQLRKRFGGSFEGSAAYTYGRSYSVTDLTSSVAVSNYQFGRTFSGSQFDTPLAPSTFDQPHRLLVQGTVTAPWKRYPTNVTTFFTAASGTPYTYTFGGSGGRGDLNADGSSANDMIYIPTGPTDPKLLFQAATFNGVAVSAAQQAVVFDQFVRGDECLDKQRGHLMDRNSCRNPSFYTWDVTVEQQLPEYRGNRLSVRADIFNFANLLNSNWGRIRGVAQTQGAINNANFTLLTHQAMSGSDPATQVPIVTFDPANLYNRFPVLPIVGNYYQMQFSVRYAF